MSRLQRWIVIGVLALVGLVALIVTLHNHRAGRALRRYKAGLIAAGEKLTIEELTPVATPEARSAANDLVQAAWRLRTGSLAPNNAPRAMGFVLPGKASIGSRQPDIRGPGRGTNTWEDLVEDLKANGPALEQIREALKSPQFDMNLNYKMGFNLLLPHLAKLKGVAQWLSAATLNDLHAQRLDVAAADLDAVVTLASALRDERLIISQLVRIAIAAITIGPTWEALQTRGWTDAQLAGFQRAWEVLEFSRPMEQSLAMERAMGIETFDRLRGSDTEFRQFFGANYAGGTSGSSGSGAPTNLAEMPDFAFEWSKDHLSSLNVFAQETAWRRFWSYDDELRYLETLQIMLEVPRRARSTGSFASARSWGTNEYQRVWRRDDYGSIKYLLSGHLAPALERAFAKAARMEAQRELVVTAIAIERFRLRHGKPPRDLSALVPEFLSKPPVDPMDGQPVRYHAREDGTFLLYSVGEDGKDDGGDPVPIPVPTSPTSQGYYFGNGRDIVWPVPATAEEIMEMQKRETNKTSSSLLNQQMLERYGLVPANKNARP